METARNPSSECLWYPNRAVVLSQLLVLICVVARPAAAQIQLGEALNSGGEPGLFQPFAEIAGRAGDGPEGGEASLFVPLFQTERQLLFADVRGKLFDNSSSEGNWGFGYRSLLDDNWILGGWGFFDLRETTSENTFMQGVLGLEALSYEWDFRVNGYLAEGGAQATNNGANAIFTGNQILVAGGFERAYSGLDYEVGALLWTHQSANDFAEGCGAGRCGSDWASELDLELRAFAGGYYFGNDAAGFQDLTGARTRLELRAFDLPLLRSGSRLVLAGTLQHDDVRDTQAIATMQVRIPLGRGANRHLGRLRRRMVDPVQRDVDIVTGRNGVGGAEAALLNGNPTGLVTQTSGAMLQDTVDTTGSGTLFVSGNGSVSMPIMLKPGQHVLGGGQAVTIQGASSGAITSFLVPGLPVSIDGTDDNQDVFQIADNTTINGVTITNGRDGVVGDNVNGFTLSNLVIRRAADDGVDLNGTFSGDIVNVSSSFNDALGFELGVMDSGTISQNTAIFNGSDGFFLDGINAGMLDGNTSLVNEGAGIQVINLAGGLVRGNTTDGNTGIGLRVSTFSDGTIVDNTANDNSSIGIVVSSLEGGTLTDNSASRNLIGIQVSDISSGVVTNNTATENDFAGFFVFTQDGGSFTNNTATGNTGDGFTFVNLTGGTAGNNTASGSGSDGFEIGSFLDGANAGSWTAGVLENNAATDNTQSGFRVNNRTGGTAVGNTATGNADNTLP